VRIEEQIEAELRRLVGVLEELMLSSRRSQRDLERELDLGNGYLSHLFKGRRELKVKHILMLGKVLGFDLLSFAERAYRRRGRTPEWALQQMESGTWERPGPLPAPALAPGLAPGLAPMSPPPLDEERIRQLVRDEVRRLGLGGDGSDRAAGSDRSDRGPGLEPPRPGLL
jgi:transcriptional regulator with XRE-family HTH domain